MAEVRARTRPAEQEPNRFAGIFLAIMAIVAALLLLAMNPTLLVALTSNRDGQPLLEGSTLAPGATTQGSLVLANEGLLPLDYSVKVEAGTAERDANVILRLKRNHETNYFYQGPLPDHPIAIGRLLPGQHDDILVVLWAPSGHNSASIPIDDTFTWTGRSPGLDYWWWLLLIAILVAAAAFLGPRLLDLWARLRRIQPLPFELYWRVPLILAVLLAACLIPLTGVSLASVNSQSENPANVFAIGTLALSDRSPSGTTCISTPGAPGGINRSCDAIFKFNRMGPGGGGKATVTIRNQGTVPVGKLLLWSDGCASANDPSAVASGRGDICGTVLLNLHDDTHGFCYYPVQTPGDCPSLDTASVSAFAHAFPQATPLSLNPADLGTGVVYSFALQLSPSADNTSQGRQLSTDFTWQIVSPS